MRNVKADTCPRRPEVTPMLLTNVMLAPDVVLRNEVLLIYPLPLQRLIPIYSE
jgi:hypothetical protein